MSNVHTKSDLLQMQSLPLSAKIRMSQARIRTWYDHWEGMVYVSFSGGKDSTVLKHLVEQTVGDVPSLFVNTGLEYPEIQRFAKSQPNVVVMRPEKRFDQVIKEYGYPVISKEVSNVVEEARRHKDTGKYTYRVQRLNGTLLDKDGNLSKYNCPKYKYLLDAPFKISDKCCNVMKKKPAHQYEKETGRKAFIGTMAVESRLRQQQWFRHGCNAFEKGRPTSQPLSFWTEQDILQYIKEYNLEYCSVYGDIVETGETIEILGKEIPKLTTTGAKRTGCMFCMFGMSQDGCPNRFQKMKDTHPNQYKYCMKEVEDGGLGLRKVLEFIGEEWE